MGPWTRTMRPLSQAVPNATHPCINPYHFSGAVFVLATFIIWSHLGRSMGTLIPTHHYRFLVLAENFNLAWGSTGWFISFILQGRVGLGTRCLTLHNFATNHWSVYPHVYSLIEISIHKPFTDNCGGLRLEPVTIEKHVNLALPIFERTLFFCKAYFLLEVVPIIPVYVSEQTFLRKRCSYGVYSGQIFCCFTRRDRVLHLHGTCTPITFYITVVCHFFDVFFNGYRNFYPQTTAVMCIVCG